MYSPVTRLLLLLNLLQSRPGITATQIATRLEVNTRSVRRYITMLQDLGIPVETIRGRNGGYRLRPGYKLPPLMWTEEEAIAITLGLHAAQQLGLTQALPSLESALAKVERVLPIPLREQVQALQATVTLDLAVEALPPVDKTKVLIHLSTAAYQQKQVRLLYHNQDGLNTTRLFDCYGLVYRRDRWYAAGYCHLRQALRVLRLDHIVEIVVAEETFQRPGDFDALAYMLQSFATIPARWQVKVLLHATLEELTRVVPPEYALLQETPSGVLMQLYDDELMIIARFLVGLAHPFQVLEPSELRTALRQFATNILAMSEDRTAF